MTYRIKVPRDVGKCYLALCDTQGRSKSIEAQNQASSTAEKWMSRLVPSIVQQSSADEQISSIRNSSSLHF
ncbi:hypothetical protein Sjap_026171 [Stephania japonica]|uniref:Uncharacterized protein n=1 Tax=Stephania japonica TaxID=461633 RepID=A0AAP0E5L6_9MAGN